MSHAATSSPTPIRSRSKPLPHNVTYRPRPTQRTPITPRGRAALKSDDSFSFLPNFHSIVLVDDKPSMTDSQRNMTIASVARLAEVVSDFDPDGLDVYLVNTPDRAARGFVTPWQVFNWFGNTRPVNGESIGMGRMLQRVLGPYLKRLSKGRALKPLNITVITNGDEDNDWDNAETVLLKAVRKLSELSADPAQILITFFQVGRDLDGKAALEHLEEVTCGDPELRNLAYGFPLSDFLDGVDMIKKTRMCYNRSIDGGFVGGGVRYIHTYKLPMLLGELELIGRQAAAA
ncbi:hypothetical protein ABW19_dt0204548 [Dactylella cylindrospora]|nr:hypothetical protein ABW19_dt0204548 [Dactylella cylindrospora]